MNAMTRALIHRDHLVYNLNQLRSLLPKETLICPAVKANAYGHGAVEVSRIWKEEGIQHLAVARMNEAIELREANIEGSILLLGHTVPKEIPLLLEWDITAVAGSMEYLEALEKEAKSANRPLKVHLKMDSGMGRMGCPPVEALHLAQFIHESPYLLQEGLCTHYAVADSPKEEDQLFSNQQLQVFRDCVKVLRNHQINPGILHAANSGGILTQLEDHPVMVRPGIALYGYSPDGDLEHSLDLKPVMELECPIILLKRIAPGSTVSYGRTWTAEKETVIGVLPMGYADGYSRSLSNRGKVWVNGKLYPVIGRVCMDQMIIDLGPHPEVKLYDRAVIFGPTPGALDAQDLAQQLGTIPYEITCGINSRVPRIISL